MLATRLNVKHVAATAIMLTVGFAAELAHADMPKNMMPTMSIMGTWTLDMVDNVMPDGSRIHLYGDHPQGRLTLGKNGSYSLQILRGEGMKFMSNDRSMGTPEENKAAVTGSIAHFGRYMVDDAKHMISFHVEHASFPNWDGKVLECQLDLKGDKLTYVMPSPSTGAGAKGEVAWHRLQPMTAQSGDMTK